MSKNDPPEMAGAAAADGQIDHSSGNPAVSVRPAGKAMTLKGLWLLTRDAFFRWSNDNPFQMGAALAYYTLFSFAPLLLIAIAVAGSLFGQEAAQSQLIDAIQNLVGFQSARAILAIIESAGKRPGSGFFATVAGMIFLLLGAAAVIGQLQDSLNAIWRVGFKTGRGLTGFVQDRLILYSMVLGVGFLLIVWLAAGAVLTALSTAVRGYLPIDAVTAYTLDIAISFALSTLLFAVIYKFVPDARIAWRDVWIGAATASLLFSVGKFFIGFYLGHSMVASVYGAAGSLVTLLLWVYYSSLIFFFGAELTQVYATRYGSNAASMENANAA